MTLEKERDRAVVKAKAKPLVDSQLEVLRCREKTFCPSGLFAKSMMWKERAEESTEKEKSL